MAAVAAGVTSTIIGARRLDQLEQNLAALDITLRDADVAALNAVSEPALNFPAPFFRMIPAFAQGGRRSMGRRRWRGRSRRKPTPSAIER